MNQAAAGDSCHATISVNRFVCGLLSVGIVLYCFLVSSWVVFVLSGCSKTDETELPKSVELHGDIVEFSLKDSGYKAVEFGSDAMGNWIMIPMEKCDSAWTVKIFNPHRPVQYKFLTNGSTWIIDPMNQVRAKVPPPFAGYNSVVVLK
ncbi:MAG: hypothetical protein ACP5ON_11175 [Bacteroidota bacterium]